MLYVKKGKTDEQHLLAKIHVRYGLARKNDPLLKSRPDVVAQRLKYTPKNSPIVDERLIQKDWTPQQKSHKFHFKLC